MSSARALPRGALHLLIQFVVLLGLGCSASDRVEGVRASISSGTIVSWPEATEHLRFDTSSETVTAEVGAPRPTGLSAFWSIATTHPESGFFYADAIRGTEETRVAWAKDVRDVHDIRDASKLEYSRDSVGPIPASGIVVIEHRPERRYLAIVVDAFHPTDPRTAGAGPYAYADVRWYLTAPDQVDFGAAP